MAASGVEGAVPVVRVAEGEGTIAATPGRLLLVHASFAWLPNTAAGVFSFLDTAAAGQTTRLDDAAGTTGDRWR